jgi:hypothetical protein
MAAHGGRWDIHPLLRSGASEADVAVGMTMLRCPDMTPPAYWKALLGYIDSCPTTDQQYYCGAVDWSRWPLQCREVREPSVDQINMPMLFGACFRPWELTMEIFLALEVYMLNGSTLGPGANTMPYRFIAGMTP